MNASRGTRAAGSWAARKLDVLERCLGLYTTILRYRGLDLVYIDPFAGSGRAGTRRRAPGAAAQYVLPLDDGLDPDRDGPVDGSPYRALRLRYPFSRYFFFEGSRKKLAQLRDLCAGFPGRQAECEVGDGNALTRELLCRLPARGTKGVAFIDAHRAHVEWGTIGALGRTGRFDVIIDFPAGADFDRLIPRDGMMTDGQRVQLALYFGGPQWQEMAYAERTDLLGDVVIERIDNAGNRLLEHYVARLREAFPCVDVASAARNARGVPTYCLLWAGPDGLGRKIADEVFDRHPPGDPAGQPPPDLGGTLFSGTDSRF